MKKTILIICIFFSVSTIFAQPVVKSYRAGKCNTKSDYCPKWSLFHETTYNFAKLGINSVNASVVLFCNRSYMFDFCFGANYYCFPHLGAAGAPIGLDFMMGRGAWLFEIGFGADYLYVYNNPSTSTPPNPNNISWLAATGRIGVRYEKVNGLFFRAGYNPHLSLLNQKQVEATGPSAFINMVSVGIGYTFNN